MENTPNSSTPHTHGAPQKNMAMAILAYIGPLVIVSYLTSKDDPFVKFHTKQGLVLFAIEVASWIIMSIIPFIWVLWRIVHLATLILSIVGIVNASQGKEKELPVVGAWAKHFKI